MPGEVLRLFVFARHAESAANAARVLSSDPSRPVTLTEHGQEQARVLGAQLAGLHIDLAVGTRFLRTRQTIDIALHGREVPVVIDAGFDELQAGDLDGAPIEAYRSWMRQHAPDNRFPHGESLDDALRRYADALRRLLARTEPVTLVVIHELALRHIATAAAGGPSRYAGVAFANAVPYLFDQAAVWRAAFSLGGPMAEFPRETSEVIDNQDQSRFELRADGQLAELSYRSRGDRLVLVHTGVPSGLEGRGIGGKLVMAAIDRGARDGLTVVPMCPFARGWLERHPDAAAKAVIDWDS